MRLGFGTMLELVGEAGLGKTRLLQELRANADDLRVIGARCDEYESSTPYYAFRSLLSPLIGELDGTPAENTEALRALVDEVAPGLVPWIPLLALPLDVEVLPTPEVLELQPAFRRARLHGVVEEFLRSLLPDPTLLLIEDVHWIDEASSELLRHLGSTNATRPWAICCARRPGDDGFVAANGVPPVAAMTILLEPLHDDEAAELVRAAAGDRLDEPAVAELVRRAGGNPLFLQELVERGRQRRHDRAARHGRRGRGHAHRPPRASGARSAALGLRARHRLRRRRDRRRPRRRNGRAGAGALGAAVRVHRAQPVRGGRVPLPARADQGRRVRGSVVPTAP